MFDFVTQGTALLMTLIEVNIAVMWGSAVIAGTRIPTFRIAELIDEGGYTEEQICESIYPELSPLQVHAAYVWEMQHDGISTTTNYIR